MFKIRGKKYSRVITPLVLSGVLAISGCSKEIEQIDEYGGEVIETTEAEKADDGKSAEEGTAYD